MLMIFSIILQAQQFVLFESASGYALFERLQAEEIAEVTEKVQVGSSLSWVV